MRLINTDLIYKKIHNWFLIIPLTVSQCEDYSDIEKRATNYAHVLTDLEKEWFFNKQPNQISQLNITSEPIKNLIKMKTGSKPSMSINMKI
jgi:hypothetical protein